MLTCQLLISIHILKHTKNVLYKLKCSKMFKGMPTECQSAVMVLTVNNRHGIEATSFLALKKCLFIYFERKRKSMHKQGRVREREREGERESQAGFALLAQSLAQGLSP